MNRQRDLTKAAFNAALKRRGFVPVGPFGYVTLAETGCHASIRNAGPSRREQLAYLIRRHAAEVLRLKAMKELVPGKVKPSKKENRE